MKLKFITFYIMLAGALSAEVNESGVWVDLLAGSGVANLVESLEEADL